MNVNLNHNHTPVLMKEVINNLNIRSGKTYVDCTYGRGGHSSEILKHLDQGILIAIDQDESAKKSADDIKKIYSGNFIFVRDNFSKFKEILNTYKINSIDGVLYDLGLSSPQIDDDSRGFSYNKDSKLDMRMDTNNQISALDVINTYNYEQLVTIFRKYGEEPYSKSIAARIIQYRTENSKIKTSFELVEIIKRSLPSKTLRIKKHPAKRIFQAIRIEVNHELEVLNNSLEDAIELLNLSGRICVISFNSLEDRIVKTIFRNKSNNQKNVPNKMPLKSYELLSRGKQYKIITKKPIYPTVEEIKNNPRSKSAKLRVLERIK